MGNAELTRTPKPVSEHLPQSTYPRLHLLHPFGNALAFKAFANIDRVFAKQ
jgi:extradiol dioxygenase family protein